MARCMVDISQRGVLCGATHGDQAVTIRSHSRASSGVDGVNWRSIPPDFPFSLFPFPFPPFLPFKSSF